MEDQVVWHRPREASPSKEIAQESHRPREASPSKDIAQERHRPKRGVAKLRRRKEASGLDSPEQ